LRIHHLEDRPGILLIRQNEKPHYRLKNPLTQKIYENNCVRPAPDPQDCTDFQRYIKSGGPLRPNVSNIGAPTYQLSKYLAGLLSQLIGNSAHHVKNSFQFVQVLESLRVQPEDLVVSFDVVSLFTNVPIVDSLEHLSHHFEDDVMALFKHILTSTYFRFDGQFYEQTDGVAMGSTLSSVIANFFMENFEKKAIEQATHKPVCSFRYVDDTFVIWPHGQEKVTEFLNHLNGLHNKIQFTMEKEGYLPILDIDIYSKTDGSLGHKVSQKTTHTNLPTPEFASLSCYTNNQPSLP